MFKKIFVATVLVILTGVLVFGAVTHTQAKSENNYLGGSGRGSSEILSTGQNDGTYIQGQGNGGKGRGQGTGGNGAGSNGNGAAVNLPLAATGELSAEEAAALLYLREEEKLAHDVYVTLYAQWGLPVFQNISQSEQVHTDAIKALIDRYGLDDPAASQVGVFTNPELQSLYTDLVQRGRQSMAEALKVGTAIEEIDILDLEERLAQTDNADILQVFNSLKNGSYSHLRAFTSTLKTQTGEIYQPQYLSPEAYQAIISASNGNGGKGQGGGGGRRGGGRP